MLVDANTKTARMVACAAVLVAAGCHSTMSWKFGQSLGSNDAEKLVFSVFGASLDVAKVFALAFAVHSWDRRRHIKAACCILVWLTTVAYSGAAALGFAALSRDTVVAGRTSDVTDYRAHTSEQKRLTEQMEQARLNPLFTASYGCTDYNRNAVRGEARKVAELCSGYWRADNVLAELKPQVKSATLTETDPQAALMARITGYPRETVAVALAVFLAGVAEIVSAVGTWVFSSSRRKPDKREAKERDNPKQDATVSMKATVPNGCRDGNDAETVIAALQKAGRPVTNDELATILNVSKSEASKRVSSLNGSVQRVRVGRKVAISLSGQQLH